MLTLPQGRRQSRWLPLLIVLLMSSWLLIGCERVLPGGDSEAPEEPPPAEVVPDPGPVDESDTYPVEETADIESPADTAYPVETEEPADGTPRDDEETADESEEAAADEESEESANEEVAEESSEEAAEETEETATDSSEEQDTSAETPTVHTVARGENLYRIGLQYGVSWVRIAQFNNITNPNRITVGQQLRIPGPSDPIPQPTPSPHTETTYIVRAGDNLYRIGRMYGISWVQIAEANGLVNPNQIYVGQELKIPVEASGPAPEFTHTVRAGETLFRISLRYGVPWPVIAEANGLESPYVIYVGQTLVIPGG
jgi:LysM repeat protein